MENDKINPKIIFIGTPDFGAIILEELIKNNHKPVLVITNPDRPAGRKQILTPPPTKILAQKYNVPILQPKILANYKLQITNYKPDLIIVAAYGQIIPKEILETPKYGCLNVHPSLLPKYRGPSPIQTAILNGDKKTGVTIMLMDEEMDHGPILASQELKITNHKYQITNKLQILPLRGISRRETISNKTTYQQLHDKLAELGAKLLLETIPKWIKGKIKPKKQDDLKASYTKIIKKEDGKINWKKPAQEIERQIRALNPWPGTFAFIKRRSKKIRIKILEVEISKNNKLIIKKLQPEGKKPMCLEDFKKGHKEKIF